MNPPKDNGETVGWVKWALMFLASVQIAGAGIMLNSLSAQDRVTNERIDRLEQQLIKFAEASLLDRRRLGEVLEGQVQKQNERFDRIIAELAQVRIELIRLSK